MKKFIPLFLLFFVIIIWASAFVGIRYSLHNFHPGSLALLRYLTASVCMLVFYKRPAVKKIKVGKKDIPIIFFCGTLGISIYNVALNYSEISVSASTASFIIAQMPVLTIVFAIIFLREKSSYSTWIGMIASFIGTFLIAISHPLANFSYHIGLFLAILATLASTFYNILQVPLLKKLSPIQFASYAIWSGTLVLLIFSRELIYDLQTATLSSIFTVIYLGIFPGAIGYLIWSYVLSKMPASKALSGLYLSPLMTTLLGWLLIDEVPHWLAILGGIISLFGAYVVNRERFKTKSANSTQSNRSEE